MDKLTVEIELVRLKFAITQETYAGYIGINSKTYRKRVDNGDSFSFVEITSLVSHLFCLDCDIVEFEMLHRFYSFFTVGDIQWTNPIFLQYNKPNGAKEVSSHYKAPGCKIATEPGIRIKLFENAVCALSGSDEKGGDISIPKVYIDMLLGGDLFDDCFAVINRCKSMTPTIRENDVLVLKNTDEFIDGKVYLFCIGDDVYCKRVFKDIITGGIILKGDDPNAPVFNLSAESASRVTIVGVVLYTIEVREH